MLSTNNKVIPTAAHQVKRRVNCITIKQDDLPLFMINTVAVLSQLNIILLAFHVDPHSMAAITMGYNSNRAIEYCWPIGLGKSQGHDPWNQ